MWLDGLPMHWVFHSCCVLVSTSWRRCDSDIWLH
jgi:hypothetical protein